MAGVVIVGAGLAGMKTAEALRVGEYADTITILGAEDHAPYDRPPLSKQVLRGEREPMLLATVDADLRLGVRASGLDGASVVLDTGERLPFEHLVVASGAAVRPLDVLPDAHYLRTVGDALRLRSALVSGARVVVVGGGFIGLEVAASARQLGCEVTVVEPLDLPLAGPLGPELAAELLAAHRSHGVVVRTGVSVGPGLTLSDGTSLTADVVVVGIGVTPDVGWLDGSGISCDDGVVVDEQLRASVPGVWAVGDCARWYDTRTGVQARAEHWTNATEMAEVAAANILGGAAVHSPVPYFWTDHYDLKVHALGWTSGSDERRVLTVGPKSRRVVLYGREGRLWGVAGIGAAGIVRSQHASIAEHALLADVEASLR
jgi:NADPH-dependent 2,4-dienoyl-CoA reductase/sulfur reductase-like enzyme